MKTIFNVILICFFILPVLSQQVSGNYTLTPVKGGTEIQIGYKVTRKGAIAHSDSANKKSGNVFERYFSSASNKQAARSGKYYTAVRSDIIDLVSSNNSLQFLPYYPDYILEMIGLIKGKKKQEKAKQIYIRNNISALINDHLSTNMTTQSGNWEKTISVGYQFSVAVKKETVLHVPSFVIRYDDEDFETPVMDILLR